MRCSVASNPKRAPNSSLLLSRCSTVVIADRVDLLEARTALRLPAVVESVAQQQAAAMQWGVRPLVFAETTVGLQRAASCSPMALMARQILAAAVRFWFLATPSLVRAPE